MSVEELLAQQHAQQSMGMPPQQGGQPPQGPQGKSPEPPPSAEEVAQKAASPMTEDKQASEDPVVYDVEINGKTEQLTPSQIAGMKERYSALNRDHMEAKPVMDLFRALKEKTGDGEAASKFLMQALQKNSQMGQKKDGESHSEGRNDKRDDKPEGKTSIDEQLTKWAEENSVEIPPGLQDMNNRFGKLEQQNKMLMQMLMDVRKQGQAVNQNAQQAQAQGQAQGQQVQQTRVQSNMERAAQQHGVSEDQAQDFMLFIQQRGYDASELIDPQLTSTLMGDFASSGNSEELAALKRVMQKRQAHSGSMGGNPQSAGDLANQDVPKHERLLQRKGM